MTYDLVIRNGRVVDGSGMPGFTADVAVQAGRVAAVGRIAEAGTRTIDADGLVVAPGFIDHHTHLDAQMLWDPYGTCEPQHGVTTAIMGNCALTLAPVQESGRDALVGSFVRVEAMPRSALEAGVGWGWSTFREYLDALEGRIGINVGGLVGHIAVRQYVMGEESVQRPATEAEQETMRRLVAESLQGGALGFSTNRNARHMREDGQPIASRLGDDEELFGLCDVLGELNAGVIQVSLGLHTVEHVAWYDRLARRTGRPIIWQSIRSRWNEPTLWREQLDALETTFRDGFRSYGITNTVQLISRFTMKNCQVFDEFPTWKNVMFLPEALRREALADPETRAKLRADLQTERQTSFHRNWNLIRIIKVGKHEHAGFLEQSVAAMAAARGQDPLDAFLDLSLEEDFETTFWTSNTGDDPEAVGEILRSPHVLIGQSDAGAHIQYLADFGYGTTLLGNWVRNHGVMPLERAIQKLTFQVASIYGLRDRGLLRPGFAADLVVFDPATVGACEPEWAEDFPGNTRRLIQRSEGVHYTVVNGRIIYEEGQLTGDLPGQVVRGAAS